MEESRVKPHREKGKALDPDKRFKGACQECEVFFRGTEKVILDQAGWG